MKQKYKVFINDQVILFLSYEPDFNLVPDKTEADISEEDLWLLIEESKNVGEPLLVFRSTDPKAQFDRFVKRFRMIEAAGGLVSRNDDPNQILMIHRLGKWDLPKGKLDPDESPEACALREVEEECGIGQLTILHRITPTFHIYKLKNKTVIKKTHWFRMTTTDNSKPVPQVKENIEQARWIAVQELPNILPGAYRMIAEILIDETQVDG